MERVEALCDELLARTLDDKEKDQYLRALNELINGTIQKKTFQAILQKILHKHDKATHLHNMLIKNIIKHAILAPDHTFKPEYFDPQPNQSQPQTTVVQEADPKLAPSTQNADTAAQSAAPRLSLRIKRDSTTGDFAASGRDDMMAPQAAAPSVVDPAEADRLHALNDRMVQICTRQGIEIVDPAATAYMNTSVRALLRRLLIAGNFRGPHVLTEKSTVQDAGGLSHHIMDAVLSSNFPLLLPANEKFPPAVRRKMHLMM